MNKLKTKIYDQISDYKRLKLIKMVKFNLKQVVKQKISLNKAAKILNINYSSAKTIHRVFNKEKRIFKKCSKFQKNYCNSFENYLILINEWQTLSNNIQINETFIHELINLFVQ